MLLDFIKRKKNAEYLKPGTEIICHGVKEVISDSYPSKKNGYMYVTTTGAVLYRNEFEIVT